MYISYKASSFIKALASQSALLSQLIFYFIEVRFVHKISGFCLCVQAHSSETRYFMSELMYKTLYIS